MELFLTLPWFVKVFISFGFGVIIGSFLNVYLYRFHTGKSLAGKSHCLSCGTLLKPYELVPLFSYLGLRGHCRTCGAVIPARYFLVEMLTGLLFVGVVLTATDLFIMIALLGFVSALVVIAVYDLYHFIIPDELVLFLLVLAFTLEGYALLYSASPITFMYDLLVAFLGSFFLFSLWRISDGRWIGFGDVKLALPLGLVVGWSGVFSMVVLSFWVGAIIGLFLLGLQKLNLRGKPHLRFLSQRLTIKSAVPFAPFLIIGFLLVLLFDSNVIDLLSYVN